MTVNRTLFGRPLRGVAFDVCVSARWWCSSAWPAAVNPASPVVGGPPWSAWAMAVALLFRRTHPSRGRRWSAALALIQVVAGWGPLAYDVAVLIALYSVVKYADRLRDGMLAGPSPPSACCWPPRRPRAASPGGPPRSTSGWSPAAVWLVALNVRTRRLYVLSLEERAATLEREREAEARRGGRRGARPDRPGAARRGGAQHGGDDRAGRRGAVRARPRPGARPARR